jgi:hypothetical protein
VSRPESTNSRHFHQMWVRSFAGFLHTASESDAICFAPELLPNSAVLDGRHVEINYARLKDSPAGPVEETDRWLEALLLCEMARQAFSEAAAARYSARHA